MHDLLYGFSIALSANALLYCALGVTMGTAIGVLPGIGSLAAVSMLLPISFHLDPTHAIILLAGVYYGAEYGGSTASILLNLPGTPSNAVTCLDGYPMAQQGRGGIALFMTTIASFLGGCTGILVLIFLTPAVIALSLSFGAAEYFAVILVGLLAAGTVTEGRPVKGLCMVAVGLLLGTVGSDVSSGTVRYAFGSIHLYDGISLVALAMGLFGVSEVILSINARGSTRKVARVSLRSMVPTRDDMRRSWLPMGRGAGVGSVLGALPGTGPLLASFMSYLLEKRVARQPNRFGKGAIEGIAGPEAANNAAVQTAFVPALSMGIPGSATTAVMLGAMMIHGITPGPRLMTEHPDLFWGVIASFWVGNLFLLVLNLPLIGVWVSILRVPYRLLYPGILFFICIGVFSVNYSLFDVFSVLVIGVIGYGLRLLGFHPAPLLIGFILGPMLEEYFRRAMLLARGDFMVILTRPISGTIMLIGLLLMLYSLWSTLRQRKTNTAPSVKDDQADPRQRQGEADS